MKLFVFLGFVLVSNVHIEKYFTIHSIIKNKRRMLKNVEFTHISVVK